MKITIKIILFFLFQLILSVGYAQLKEHADYFNAYDDLIEQETPFSSTNHELTTLFIFQKGVLPSGQHIQEGSTVSCRILSSNKRFDFTNIIPPCNLLETSDNPVNTNELYSYFPHALHIDFYIFTLLRIRI